MKLLSLFGKRPSAFKAPKARQRSSLQVECLEAREVMTASPMPVLMVIADQQDFYYRKPLDISLTAKLPQQQKDHHYTGNRFGLEIMGANAGGVVFVGGWGSSMYQYS